MRLEHGAHETTSEESVFDAVLMVNLRHVVHDPSLILQECSRVLRNDG
jgi:SAM-dependent methyltransferase